MATLFKKTIVRYLVDGKRVKASEARRLQAAGHVVQRRIERSRKWYVRYRLPDGRIRQVAGYVDRGATMALATRLERDAAREAAGLATPTDRHLADPVESHLAAFVADLEARQRTAKHVRLTINRTRAVLQAGGVRRLADLDAHRVQAAVGDLRRGGLATETANHYLVAVKGFTRWLWRQGRLATDPLAGLRRLNPEPDRRVVRRALSSEELARLVQAAESSQTEWRDLDGRDRAAIYLLAAGSGLRVHELGTLTYADLVLDADPPRVAIQAAYAKNRRQDVIPLPRQVAEYLRGYLANRPSVPADQATRIWPGTWWQRAAGMKRLDLQAAGIEYTDASGRVADFHGLRSTYATLLARRGVNLQTAQALLRHSDPKLTARTYTKLGITDLAGAVADMTLAPPADEASRGQRGGL